MRPVQRHIDHDNVWTTPTSNAWFNRLQSFEQTQLSFQNTTTEAQKLSLWGGNKIATFLPKSLPIQTGTSPQAIAYNSYNNRLYIVNQLEGSITVVIPGEVTGTTVRLEEPNTYPSPVDIAVNTVDGSIYVIGSLSNKLYHIDANLSVKKAIELDNRPISIAINPINQQLYITHLLAKQVSVVALDSLLIENRITTVDVATHIAVNEQNGSWAAVLPETDTLQIFDKDNQVLSSITEEGTTPTKALFDAAQDRLFVITTASKELLSIDTDVLKVTQRLSYDNSPIALSMDNNQNIYVGLQESNSLLVYDQTLTLIQSKTVESIHGSIHVDSGSGVVYIPNPVQSVVLIEQLDQPDQPAIVAQNGYQEVLRDFQFKPAKIEHVRVQFSGAAIAPVFRIGTDSTRGKVSSRVISLCKFTSPQHFSQIFEVTDFRNEIINGNSFWEITIPPEQHLSLLLYYSQ